MKSINANRAPNRSNAGKEYDDGCKLGLIGLEENVRVFQFKEIREHNIYKFKIVKFDISETSFDSYGLLSNFVRNV